MEQFTADLEDLPWTVRDGSRTPVRYALLVGTWHDPAMGRPIAAPLQQRAELLGVDLATIQKAADTIEPYLRADGTGIWSLMQLERQPRPEAYGSDTVKPVAL